MIVVRLVEAVDLDLAAAAARVDELVVADVDRGVGDAAAAAGVEQEDVPCLQMISGDSLADGRLFTARSRKVDALRVVHLLDEAAAVGAASGGAAPNIGRAFHAERLVHQLGVWNVVRSDVLAVVSVMAAMPSGHVAGVPAVARAPGDMLRRLGRGEEIGANPSLGALRESQSIPIAVAVQNPGQRARVNSCNDRRVEALGAVDADGFCDDLRVARVNPMSRNYRDRRPRKVDVLARMDVIPVNARVHRLQVVDRNPGFVGENPVVVSVADRVQTGRRRVRRVVRGVRLGMGDFPAARPAGNVNMGPHLEMLPIHARVRAVKLCDGNSVFVRDGPVKIAVADDIALGSD